MTAGLTLTQKILCTHMVGSGAVTPGSTVRVAVDWTMASELALNGMMSTFERLGNPRLFDKDRFYLAVDHTVDPVTVRENEKTRRLVALCQNFAKANGLTAFYDANETIMHTRFYRDHCLPGQIVLGADSHTTSHGALGALAIGLGGADVAIAALTGETWLEVPEAISVVYEGETAFGIGGKDIILHTLGTLGRNRAALERTVEYGGPAAAGFTTDTRFTICNMTAELGGMNGIFEPTAETVRFLESRGRTAPDARFLRADEDADYAETIRIDLHHLSPKVAKPFSPDNVFDVEDVTDQALDGCFIGACTTTEEELVLGGMLLDLMWQDGHRPVPSSRRLVVPGDLEIRQLLADTGLDKVYERAGYRIGVPGCHLCLGVGSERAGDGEIWLSSQNRNYRNRMGKGSLAWLSSAATVAASSYGMAIADPRPYLARIDQNRYHNILGRQPSTAPAAIEIHYENIPAMKVDHQDANKSASLSGLVSAGVQKFGDHVDTDAIIPGEFCNLSDWTELGEHCFEYVRPGMKESCTSGNTIIVAGEAWGSGSAREHAAWALIGAGVELVIARGFAATHRRNLVNEGLPTLVVDDPDFFDLVDDGTQLQVNLATGSIRVADTDRIFQGQCPAGEAASILASGGVIAALKQGNGQPTRITNGG